ncbi:MAG: aminoacetone oxidase family FAD-binding enzyme [Methanobrevibacter sp.]|uniref:NAD(P)/FAD-dependent oxidoreductase n=1 Tax=uncultured Methanobrevibacter sp. TaxID=253161 RepID=UPI0025DCE5EF|nr:aminoacetone oxidase family FAD-binding enzyme [uncultured Methanobrevibacter sp.]MEE1128687.1 aminoacetone oxidase family FAD-binding enzyme [Methanobrevibacter sp.]
MEDYDIAIIGGGPAGMMAAIAASQNSSKVILLEKNPSLGRKLLLTGGGRCNITNNKPIKQLLNSFNNKNFLKHSFYTFTNEDLFSLFDIDFVQEDNNRVFPKSGRSRDILEGLTDKLEDVVISCNFEVKKISEGFVINDKLKADKIIIATGGVTYPKTGCNIENYSLTSQPLTDIKYGLSPLITEKDLSAIAGVTLSDVVISYKKHKIKGNVLFSHVGLTGPGIINLSNKISEGISYNLLENNPDIDLEIAIDLCPEYSREELFDRFTSDFQSKGKTMLKNYLKLFLTNSFIDYFLSEINMDSEVQLSRINKKSKNRLIENLKRFPFKITAFNDNLAKVTIGGVDLKHINSKTMESTVIPGLYFAGEVLDVHGPTGGYNLKIAFSTGFLAGLSASEK